MAKQQQPPGCTCDPSAPARKRCTTKTFKCSGALVAHADNLPPIPASRTERDAYGFSAMLSQLAATLRPTPIIPMETLAAFSRAADLLHEYGDDLLRRRARGVEHEDVQHCTNTPEEDEAMGSLKD